MEIFYYIKLFSIFVVPGLISIFEIIHVLSIKKRNGDLIFKQRKIEIVAIVICTLFLIFFIFASFGISSIKQLIIYIIVFFFITGAYIESSLASFLKGIYQNAIVYPGFTCEWKEIEGVIFMENEGKIRFIHEEKGAFDFSIPENIYNEISEIVQEKTPIIKIV